jgi:hypothetical protein
MCSASLRCFADACCERYAALAKASWRQHAGGQRDLCARPVVPQVVHDFLQRAVAMIGFLLWWAMHNQLMGLM